MEKRNDLLTLDDAVKVCMDFLYETTLFDDMPEEEKEDFEELVRQEMEQKVWINGYSSIESLERLNNLTFEIHPAEIARQIERDNLRKWCETLQVQIKMAMVELPLK